MLRAKERKNAPMENLNASKLKGILDKVYFSLSRNLKRTQIIGILIMKK